MKKETNTTHSIVMLGATGAVGTEALKALLSNDQIMQVTTLGRRPVPDISNPKVQQHNIDIFDPITYADKLSGHDVAICTLGVGQPSKMSKEEFIKIDKKAVIDFARACKNTGIRHFELLSSVGIDAKSRNFFLRTKGELVEDLKKMKFERLSIFQPSMILTPNNRYGFSQALTLFVWPIISPLMIGALKKFRGIKVDQLGKAFVANIFRKQSEFELLKWSDFNSLNKS